MPANLSPEYYEAEARYKAASTGEERLAALRAMLSAIPKHKGTEKMQADLKSRIARAKQDADRESHAGRSSWDPSYVPREGAGQVPLLGGPSAGKSALVAALTNAEPEVAAYPYTTQVPQPAMMPFENTQVQLVDAPAISEDFTPGWMVNLARLADLALLVADAGSEACLENADHVVELLASRRVHLVRERTRPHDGQARDVEIPTLLVAAQVDRPGAADRIDILREFLGDRFDLLEVSIHRPETLEHLRTRIWEGLGMIRVCTKAPGKDPETDRPFVLPRGSTVVDLAREIHKDLERNLRYARIWGEGYYDGQRVQQDQELGDMDIVELHE